MSYPDLPGCLPCAFTLDEDMHNSREALTLHLYNLEDEQEIIPEPSDILSIPHDADQAVILVEACMPPIREKLGNKSVDKIVTLPLLFMLYMAIYANI